MNENPFSKRLHWGVDGVKRVARLSMLDAEFHPRSRDWCVGCVCVCVSGLVLGVTVNLIDLTSSGKLI